MLGRLLLVAVSSQLLLACATAPVPAVEAERAALQARQNAFLQDVSEKDAQQVAGYFAEAGVLQIPNIPAVKGRAAIAAFYTNIFGLLTESTSTPQRLEIASDQQLAYGSGAVTNVFEGPQGRQELSGQYQLTWQKQQGEWRILEYSLSSSRAEAQ